MVSERDRSCEIRLRVPFCDLDPMHVVWHGNYLKYFDMARFALFDRMGVDLYGLSRKGEYTFPVIKTSVKYIHPLRYADEFITKATIVDAQIKIILDFEIRLADSSKICARGRGEQVAVSVLDMEMQLEIPEVVRTALGFS